MKKFESFGSYESIPDREGQEVQPVAEHVPVTEYLYATREGAPVEVTVREFEPREHDQADAGEKKRHEIVFLPGVGLDVDTKSAEELGRTLADDSNGGKTYVVRSKVRENIEDPLVEESHAVVKFLDEKMLDDIILVGQSQGGDKAAHIAAALGDRIRALVLLDSVGLREQSPAELAKSFFGDAMLKTPPAIIANLFDRRGVEGALKRSVQVGTDVMIGIARDIISIHKEEPNAVQRVKREVATLARLNPELEKITAPVVIISGKYDDISNPEKIAPEYKKTHGIPAFTQLGQELYGIDSEHEARIANANARNEELQRQMFPNSPWCKMVEVEKLGLHGVANFRPEAVSRVALGVINRQEKAQAKRDREESVRASD